MTSITNTMQPAYMQYLQRTPAQGNQFAMAPQTAQVPQGGPQGMMQLMQMMMQLMQAMGGAQPQQQQAQMPQQAKAPQQAIAPPPPPPPPPPQNAQAPQGPQGMMQMMMQMMQKMMQMMGMAPPQQQNKQNALAPQQNATGFPVAKGGAAASAAAGNGGAAASAAAGKGGAAASAAAGKGGASASAAAGGKKDFKSMSNDELQEYWNKHKDKESGKEIHDRAKTKDNKTSEGKNLHDPYEVNINGEKYVFVQDKNKNGQIDGAQEFLGYNDKKGNLFNGMKKLDTNGDGQVSKAEMDAQGVKLQKVDKATGKLTNEAKDVANVNVNSFKANQNFNGEGEAGQFQVQLADGQTVQGKEIFENMQKLMSYFS